MSYGDGLSWAPHRQRRDMDAQQLVEYLDAQIARTDEQINKPVDVPSFPSPEFWKGYRTALSDTRNSVMVLNGG